MSDPVPPSPAPWRRRLLLALVVLVPIGLVVGVYVYLVRLADWRLQQAVAETDRLSQPAGWRLADLEAERPSVPDAENSALQIMKVKALMPPQWGSAPEFYQLFADLPPAAQLNDFQRLALNTELHKAEAARNEARKLADMPHGHYTIAWSPDFVSTIMPMQDARIAADLLRYDVLALAQEQDADGALRSTHALLNAGRSTADVPATIAQFVHIACTAMALHSLERVLAQGEPSPAGLAALQQLLEEEDAHWPLLLALRGERAGDDQLLEGLQTGTLKISSLGLEHLGPDEPGAAEQLSLYLPGGIKNHRAALLHFMNEEVEIARLPLPQQQTESTRLMATARAQPLLVRLLAPATDKLVAACLRHHAQLRCAIVLLAAERYRRTHHHWPGSLPELVQPGLLREIPTDPYDGAPLRFRRLDDGLVIYTLGPDLQDNGGHLDRQHLLEPGNDLGFRLWDSEHRRQPPLPPAPVGPVDGGPPALPGPPPGGIEK